MDITLTEALTRLAELRRDGTDAEIAVSMAHEEVEKTPQAKLYATRVTELHQIKGEIATAEAEVRNLTLLAYAQTGDKKPATGATIKTFHELRYDDGAMLRWCQANRPTYVMLSIDRARIGKAAEDLRQDGAPLVIVEVPKPQIDKDLSKLLAVVEPAQEQA